MNRLLQFIDGKSVAVVGNGPETEDVSGLVDACDIVLRFNHMYRYGDKKTGKKISAIMQTFTSTYMSSMDRHNAEILRQRPEVFLVKQRGNYAPWCHAFYGPDIRVNDLIDHFAPWHAFSTGGAVVCYLAQYANNSTFKVFGFPGGKAWDDYIAGDGHWYQNIAAQERKAVDEAKGVLATKFIRQAPCGIPRVIVVPIKANSSGRPGKNRDLLFPLLEKIKTLPYDIVICGDDSELLYSAELAFPDKVRAFHSQGMHMGNTEDVNTLLKNWRNGTAFCGDIALVQCTSPDLEAKWIEDCFAESAKSALVATAVPLEFKSSSIYKCDFGGVYTPLAPQFGAASTARQNLPVCVRITGAVEVFHSDALDFPSFWQSAYMRPYVISSEKSTDVD